MPGNAKGLTLIEFMTATAILILLVTLGWPKLQEIGLNGQRRTSLNSLHHAFALARTDAIKNATVVTICPLNGGNICTGDWSREVSIFRDPDAELKLTDNANLLRTVQPPDTGELKARTGNRGYFQYAPSGRVRGTLGNITFCPPDDDPTLAGQVVVNMGGRMRLARDRDDDGIVEASDGSPVRCP